MAEQIIDLIEKLPPYICYLYPGYISMFLFYFFMGYTLSESKAKVIKSVAISYIYILIALNWFIPMWNGIFKINIDTSINTISFNFVMLIFSILFPYLAYRLFFRNELLEIFLDKIKVDTTLDRNEIDGIQRLYNDNIWIKVYIKNRNIVYSGSLVQYELEDGKTKFFCLCKYRKFIIGKQGRLIKILDHSDDDKERVLVYFDEISHFEIANVDKE